MKKLFPLVSVALLSACTLSPSPVGTYQGELPCADCEKISAELQLNPDNTYRYNTVYFKRGKTYPFSENGVFTRGGENNSVIKLVNSDNLTLKLGEGYVEVCDKDGNTIKSEANYKLQKVK